MIEKHEIIITIPTGTHWNEHKRKRFNEKIIDPLIKELASNWPSIRIEQIKEESLL